MSGRAYEKSHPWLTFHLDTRRFNSKLWILLGEVNSKFEHLAGSPLQPDVAKELNTIYLAKGVRATTAIEGNTLSEEDVEKLIRKELVLPPSKKYLAKEVDNILRCCNELWTRTLKGAPEALSVETIKWFNGEVLKGLDVEAHVTPGDVRRVSVGVFGYRGAPAEDCEILLHKLVDWLNGDEFKAGGDIGAIPTVLAAIVAHLYIAWIHPFGDGNGRTARLVEFALLVKSGVPMPAAHLLSNHYNETRAAYYRHLDLASKDREQGIYDFIQYAVQGLVDGLREQIARIRKQQIDVAWQNFVHEHFTNATAAQKRQRDLVLAMSTRDAAILQGEMLGLTPHVATAYAASEPATAVRRLRRDIVALIRASLIRREGLGWRANKEIMAAFLPPRATKNGG